MREPLRREAKEPSCEGLAGSQAHGRGSVSSDWGGRSESGWRRLGVAAAAAGSFVLPRWLHTLDSAAPGLSCHAPHQENGVL